MNDIFSYFLPQVGIDVQEVVLKRKAYASWFTVSFPESEFTEMEKLFYNLTEYASSLDIPLTERLLDIYSQKYLKAMLYKHKLHITGTELFSYDDTSQMEEALKVTKDAMYNEYMRLLDIKSDINNFKCDVDAFMQERLNERLVNMYKEGFEIISNVKNKLMGAGDALNFTEEQVSLIREVYDRDKLEELDSVHSASSVKKMRFISDTGLPTVDNDCHGIFSTQLFGIEAAPGIGKTKFSTGVWAYRAAVINHRNVAYYALEQPKSEIESLLISRHIFHLFNKQVPADFIDKDLVPKELQETVAIARQDLFESGKYGKIEIFADVLYLETFIQKFKTNDSLKGPFDMVIVDYMTLIEQKGGNYAKALMDYEISKKAYKKFKRYLRAADKCGIAVNQLNLDGVKKSGQDKTPDTTGAAGGAETYRSTDYNIVLSCTPQMEAQMKRRLSVPKKRGTEGFGSVIVDVRLAVCYFYQNKQERI